MKNQNSDLKLLDSSDNVDLKKKFLNIYTIESF